MTIIKLLNIIYCVKDVMRVSYILALNININVKNVL